MNEDSLVLRQYLYDTKQSFVLDVGEELGVYLTKPQLYSHPIRRQKPASIL
jgi:hypothetical protein